jgi:hypothetical protein
VACAQLTGDARYSAVAVIHPIIWGAFVIGCLSMQLSQTYDITSSTLRFIYCNILYFAEQEPQEECEYAEGRTRKEGLAVAWRMITVDLQRWA